MVIPAPHGKRTKDVNAAVKGVVRVIKRVVGLSPEVEEGTRRQKRGDVHLEPLPAAYAPISMADVMSRVFSGIVASGIRRSARLQRAVERAGVQSFAPGEEGVFLDDLVPVDIPGNVRLITVRDERVVFTGGSCPGCPMWCGAPGRSRGG
jgi:hypothetical protein